MRGTQSEGAEETPTPMLDPSEMSLEQAVDAYGELEAALKAAEKRKKAIAEVIKGAARVGAGTLTGEFYAVTVTEVAGRKTLDKDAVLPALAAAGHDPENFMKVSAPYVRLSASKLR